MSVRDMLVEKASELVDDKSEGWLSKAIKEGKDLSTEDTLGKDGKKSADDALAIIEKNQKPLLRLGKVGFALLLSAWEDDDEAAAQRLYLETQATYSERRAALQAAGDNATQEREERDKAWEEVKGVLQEVGLIGLKFLVNMAAKSVGLPISL